MHTMREHITDAEFAILEPMLKPNPDAILSRMSEKDTELAKLILANKGHLGPLGMVECGIVLGRFLMGDEELIASVGGQKEADHIAAEMRASFEEVLQKTETK